ncbi:hypothetical protein [Marinoscillum furvescens]|uniref:Lipocalin-like protein n=1 Tax=Marinoscillum furvescens DSM 4134 TaxID=1122208 RepID=A0A3D9LJT8_MARFU|nr:hypothetical protein [Marinoscillum furvescens]REE05522.1 hypothetical protein C7460_10137 [Marinoscillum furvescens DSM 4134]
MKSMKQLLAFAVVAMMIAVSSCKKDDDNTVTETERDLVLTALQGTWTVDASSSFANTEIDASGVTATFTETGFQLTGNIESYATGGTYTVAEDGSISDVTVNLVPENLEINGTSTVTLSAAKDQLTVNFATVQSDSRVGGLGEFNIILNAN